MLGNTALFVHRGHLHSMKGTAIDAYHYILFDDLLVKALQPPNRKKASTNWVVQESVQLVRIESAKHIPDMEGIRNCIEFTFVVLREGSSVPGAGRASRVEKRLTLGLCAASPADKALWLQKVQSCETLLEGPGEADVRRALADNTAFLKEELIVSGDGLSGASGRSRFSGTLRKSTSNLKIKKKE